MDMDGNNSLDEVKLITFLSNINGVDNKLVEFFVSQLECLIDRYGEYLSDPKNVGAYKDVIEDLETILDQAEETKDAYEQWGVYEDL